MLTTNVAEVPQPFAGSSRPPNGAARHLGVRFSPRTCDPRAFSSRGSIDFCFQGRNDRAHEAGYLGGAAAARRLDSGEDAALGGDPRAGFHENPLLRSQARARRGAEMFRDERIRASAGADFARLQVSEIAAGGTRATAHHRNDRRPVGSSAFHPAAVATSDRSPRDARCPCVAFRARQAKDAGGALRRLWSEQADDRAAVPGGIENDFQPMAPAIETAARNATAGFRRKSDRSGSGRRVQQPQRVYRDVPAAIGADAATLLCALKLSLALED